jgi:uncharacterized membrane protein YukC
MIETITEDGQPSMSESIAEYVRTKYGYSYSFRWPALGITLAFVVVLRALVYVYVAAKLRHRS